MEVCLESIYEEDPPEVSGDQAKYETITSTKSIFLKNSMYGPRDNMLTHNSQRDVSTVDMWLNLPKRD